MLWNKLGSEAEVLNSGVGEAGMVVGTQYAFEQGQFGNGYVRKATGEDRLEFPASVLQALNYRGTVEFWVISKVPHPVPYQYGVFALLGGVNTGPTAPHWRGNVYLYWGDGVTGLGWYGAVQFDEACAETPSESNQFVATPGVPIHAAISWDIEGIAGTPDKVRVYRDGALVGATTTPWHPSGTTIEGRFYLGQNPDAQGYDKWITDNIKVWNYAKTDFSDRFVEAPQPPGPQIEFVGAAGPTADIAPEWVEGIEIRDHHPNELVFATRNVGAECGYGTSAAAWKMILDPDTGQATSVQYKQQLGQIQTIRNALLEASDETLLTGGGWCGYKPPYYSVTGGETWEPATRGVHPPNSTFCLAEFNGEVYAGTGYEPWPGEVYRWLGTSGSDMWVRVITLSYPRTVVGALAVFQGRLFVGTGLIPCAGWEGSVPVYVTDDGDTFIATTGMPSSANLVAFAIAGDTLCAVAQNNCATGEYATWRWDALGSTWQMVAPYPLMYSYSPVSWLFAGHGQALYAAGRAAGDPAAGIYESLDFGATWQQIVSMADPLPSAFHLHDDTLYIGTRRDASNQVYIYRLYLGPTQVALALNAGASCYHHGDTVTVTVDMTTSPTPIVAGQVFLHYDHTKLDFVSASPGGPPFTYEVYEAVNEAEGTIDYAVMIPPPTSGTNGPATLATLTFTVIADACDAAGLVAFRPHDPATELSDPHGQPVEPLLTDLSTITLDGTPPTIACPPGIQINADAGGCTATLTLAEIGTPTVSDNCTATPAIVVTWQRSDSAPYLDDPFPAGDTVITWTATDACGNPAQCTQTITVYPVNEIAITLATPDVLPAPLTRCITFEIWPCSTLPPQSVEQDFTFVNGQASATIAVPCGPYMCLTARDKLHTLRRTLGPLPILGRQYVADFVASNKPLLGGNLNDDGWIDILDVGVYIWQYGTTYASGDTPCATPAPHADVNGDAAVGSADLSIIQTNYLAGSDADCCVVVGEPTGVGGPIEEVSAVELRALGLDYLLVADLNHDGRLDHADLELWLSGVRPVVPPAPLPGEPPRPVRSRH